MAVGESTTDFLPIPGVRLGSVACGIKGKDQLDLVMLEFAPGSATAGESTTFRCL